MAVFVKYRYKINIMNNVTTEIIFKVLKKINGDVKIKQNKWFANILPNTIPIDR